MTWRVLLAASRLVVLPACRLRVSGDISPELRAGPLDDRLASIPERRRRAYWAHLSLRQVDWSIRHHDAATVDRWLTVAESGMS